MIRRLLTVAAVALSLLAPAPALGATAIGRSGAPDQYLQRWVDAATAPLPPVEIRVERVPCPDPEGSSCTGRGWPIYLSPHDGRDVFLHELGHHFDYAMSDGARAAFLRLLGLKGQPWRGLSNSPHERFAEAWSLCAGALDPSQVWNGRVHAGYMYEPTVKTHERVCRLIRLEAASQGWSAVEAAPKPRAHGGRS